MASLLRFSEVRAILCSRVTYTDPFQRSYAADYAGFALLLVAYTLVGCLQVVSMVAAKPVCRLKLSLSHSIVCSHLTGLQFSTHILIPRGCLSVCFANCSIHIHVTET